MRQELREKRTARGWGTPRTREDGVGVEKEAENGNRAGKKQGNAT